MASVRKQRIRKWLDDPHCYWCGRETELTEGKRYHNLSATIDHLFPKTHEGRVAGIQNSHVLCCYECNQDRTKIYDYVFRERAFKRCIAGMLKNGTPEQKEYWSRRVECNKTMKEVFLATHNRDTTEGRGQTVTIGIFASAEDAVRIVQKRGVQGSPGEVFRYPVFESFEAYKETMQDPHRGHVTPDLVYGYRKDWKGSWSYGWVDNRDAPINDPRFAEFKRLRDELSAQYGDSIYRAVTENR